MIPKTLRSGLMSLLCAMTLFIAASDSANAQNPKRGYGVGVAGQGTDMWTQAMSGLRLFTPHRDDCVTASEIFIKVYTNSNSVDFGFCMDKDEHSAGAKEFEDARQECFDDGKRLPEPAEFKVACQIGTGFSNMTDDTEWISNFAVQYYRGINNYEGIGVSAGGNTGCTWNVVGWMTRSSGGGAASIPFRCVR